MKSVKNDLLKRVCMGCGVGLLWLAQGLSWGTEPAAPADPPPMYQNTLNDYGKLPLHFEPNQGQTADEVKFLARGPGYAVFLTPREIVWKLRSGGSDSTDAVVRMSFGQTAAESPALDGLEPQPGRSNYLLGHDPKRWRAAVPHFGRVRYRDLYPGIGLELYGNPQRLEYDFVVTPGADPGQIRLTFAGVEALRLDEQGQLILRIPGGELTHQAPQIYQMIDGERRSVTGRYVLQQPATDRNLPTVGFQVANYDAATPLVIDPGLIYSTHLGGGNHNDGRGIAVDAVGNVYVTGYTNSPDFPTNNPYQPQGTRYDAFVAKLDPTGRTLLYSTYLGGESSDYGYGVAVDGAGHAYVTGSTNSDDFPATPPFQSRRRGNDDVFVTRLDAAGGTLVYSTYLGGVWNDYGYAIAVDAAGNAYITGETSSDDFPVVNAWQPRKKGTVDAFVVKLDAAASTLLYATYLGGVGHDYGYAIAVDVTGYAYVVGATDSTNFPTTDNHFQLDKGRDDAFVTKLDTTGQSAIYSTYLGGENKDAAYGVAVSADGRAYVTGETWSADFPTTSGAFGRVKQGSLDAFVTALTGDGRALVSSTYLGGRSSETGRGIGLDGNGDVYVTGETRSTDFPTKPYQFSPSEENVFITRLNAALQDVLYSAYVGGDADDAGQAIAVDGQGYAYLTGTTESTDFPTAPEPPLQRYRRGARDAFVTKISPDPYYGLRVVESGNGQVTSVPPGINCPSDCSEDYIRGATVTLTATPSSGSVFAGWDGACSGTGSCQVTMTQAQSATATFTVPNYALTVAVTGPGAVSSSPAGISCGGDCQEDYPSGTAVTLTASPNSNAVFTGWGGACSGTGSCQVTMTQARSVTAVFNQQVTYSLKVAKRGNGSGVVSSRPAGINCGSDCSERFANGQVVKLTAKAKSDSVFAGWGGACSGLASTCTVTIQAKTVTAAFVKKGYYLLTVTKAGSGGGSVTSSPFGVNCGSDCDHSYRSGVKVKLTAKASSGSAFAGWSGSCSGRSSTCQVTMSKARMVKATFNRRSQAGAYDSLELLTPLEGLPESDDTDESSPIPLPWESGR